MKLKIESFWFWLDPVVVARARRLRLIAGLETSTSGDAIRIGGRVVTNMAPKDRDIAMVFQNYALYPHMSVYKNLSFGLKVAFWRRSYWLVV